MFLFTNRSYPFLSERTIESKIRSFKETIQRTPISDQFKENLVKQEKYQTLIVELERYLQLCLNNDSNKIRVQDVPSLLTLIGIIYDNETQTSSPSQYFNQHNPFQLFIEDCLCVFMEFEVRKIALQLSLDYLKSVKCNDLRFVQLIISIIDFPAFNSHETNILQGTNFRYDSSLNKSKDLNRRLEEAVYMLTETLSQSFEKENNFSNLLVLLRNVLCVIFPTITSDVKSYIDKSFYLKYLSEPNKKITILFLKIFLINPTRFCTMYSSPYFSQVFKVIFHSILNMKWNPNEFNEEVRPSLKWYFMIFFGPNVETMTNSLPKEELKSLQTFYVDELKSLIIYREYSLEESRKFLSNVLAFLSSCIWSISISSRSSVIPLTLIVVDNYLSLLKNGVQNQKVDKHTKVRFTSSAFSLSLENNTFDIIISTLFTWMKLYSKDEDMWLNNTQSLKNLLQDYWCIPGVLNGIAKVYGHLVRTITDKLYCTSNTTTPAIISLVSPEYEIVYNSTKENDTKFKMFETGYCSYYTSRYYSEMIKTFDHWQDEDIIFIFRIFTKLLSSKENYSNILIRRNIHLLVNQTITILNKSERISNKKIINITELFIPIIFNSLSLQDNYIQTMNIQSLVELYESSYCPNEIIAILKDLLSIIPDELLFTSLEKCYSLFCQLNLNYLPLIPLILNKIQQLYDYTKTQKTHVFLSNLTHGNLGNDLVPIDKRLFNSTTNASIKILSLLNNFLELEQLIIPEYSNGLIEYYQQMVKVILSATHIIITKSSHITTVWIAARLFVQISQTINHLQYQRNQKVEKEIKILKDHALLLFNNILGECDLAEKSKNRKEICLNFGLTLEFIGRNAKNIPNDLLNEIFKLSLEESIKTTLIENKQRIIMSLMVIGFTSSSIFQIMDITTLKKLFHYLEELNETRINITQLYGDGEASKIFISSLRRYGNLIENDKYKRRMKENVLNFMKEGKVFSVWIKDERNMSVIIEMRDAFGKCTFEIEENNNGLSYSNNVLNQTKSTVQESVLYTEKKQDLLFYVPIEKEKERWLDENVNEIIKEYNELCKGIKTEESQEISNIREKIFLENENKISKIHETSLFQPLTEQKTNRHSKVIKKINTDQIEITKLLMSIFNISESNYKQINIIEKDLENKINELDTLYSKELYLFWLFNVGNRKTKEDIICNEESTEAFEEVKNALGKQVKGEETIVGKQNPLLIKYKCDVIQYSDTIREVIISDISKIPIQNKNDKELILNQLINIFFTEIEFDPNVLGECNCQIAIIIQPHLKGIYKIQIYAKKYKGWGPLQNNNFCFINHLGIYIRETVIALYKGINSKLQKSIESNSFLKRIKIISSINSSSQPITFIDFIWKIQNVFNQYE
ncbi:hypothetical protein EDI_129780 [Entamoeba dispar SAW760]|uniref:Uncharacterized protein n=1 Tax=Entamoeba dispar (strain ATCC PRA-260 / SAW760) TaxID=370354 RepID=B0EDN1_ENTDS|nr:uncharacterized protein EDI_129780 [Entamoeba dispar SAW760]EDR27351.1 hypothetical protein EDI_129780 [Entamoeba dispar SAW760]|eukprot:EDR27351.1 hypothetical protein EDI_129780 [Entamoeba dispar SAW760]